MAFGSCENVLGAVLTVLALSAFAPVRAMADEPVIEHSTTAGDRLAALPRLPAAQRKIVAVYEFNSGVPGVPNAALTDMFETALVKSGAFLVAEREHLNSDLLVEKNLNGHGETTGDTAQHRLAGAQFIFEGAVTEANPNADSSDTSATIGGMTLEGENQQGKIAIDVRIVDADSGLVMDSIDVSKVIRSHGSGISGVGNLLSNFGPVPLSPDVSHSETHNEGVDEAVRACIEAAVLELVKRYASAAP